MCRRAALLLVTFSATATAVPVVFTGNVPTDFGSHPNVFTVVDPKVPITFLGGTSGWNIIDARYAYDLGSDTAYFGERTDT